MPHRRDRRDCNGWGRRQKPWCGGCTSTAQQRPRRRPCVTCWQTLPGSMTQDLEPDPSGGAQRLRRGTVRDRLPSWGDRDMRHGRHGHRNVIGLIGRCPHGPCQCTIRPSCVRHTRNAVGQQRTKPGGEGTSSNGSEYTCSRLSCGIRRQNGRDCTRCPVRAPTIAW